MIYYDYISQFNCRFVDPLCPLTHLLVSISIRPLYCPSPSEAEEEDLEGLVSRVGSDSIEPIDTLH